MKYLWLLLAIAAFVCCDSDPDGGDGDGDADGDADVGPADCPRNSGWPCTCDRRSGCDDGSACAATVDMTAGLGVCSALCDYSQPDARICPDETFTGNGLCWMASGPGDPTHCLLACGHSDNCPTDQECVDLGIHESVDFCIP